MGGVEVFNPLEKKNLALSIANALEETEIVPLAELPSFSGAGVYALYYSGAFPSYKPLAEANRLAPLIPIYVGKADRKGKRKGGYLESSSEGKELYNRLSDHAQSIRQATNLRLEDFSCRFLVVDDLWISLGESLLISRHSPVWNVLVEGFGNHDPGKGRRNGKRPLWDTLHPGRPWAEMLIDNPVSAEQIGEDALHYLTERCGVVGLQVSDLTREAR